MLPWNLQNPGILTLEPLKGNPSSELSSIKFTLVSTQAKHNRSVILLASMVKDQEN